MSLLTYPFHVLAAILRFIFSSLRIPIPSVPISLSSLSFSSLFSGIRAAPLDPYAEAERWVRALEEETGAVCVSRASGVSGKEEGEAGPSGLRNRQGAASAFAGRVLPDFWLGTYEEAVRACQQQVRIGCIVLVSAEHDDDLPFKRETLTDPGLLDLLVKEEFLLWGGDVRGREAWSASQKLGATTFPFVAFVALQPPRGVPTSGRSPTPVMTILSRHQGAHSTSARALKDHISTSLLPRVSPTLERLRNQQRERALERSLREEQDKRFEESARRDREKAEMIAMEELNRQTLAREREEAARLAEMRVEELAQAKAVWRRARRSEHIPRTPSKGGVRVGIRMPDGSRAVATCAPDESVFALYCVVDAHLHPADSAEEDYADVEELLARHALSADEWWGFKLFSAYPRKEIPFSATRTIAEEGVDGSLVVEMVGSTSGRGSPQEAANGDDGYETEDE
ncbi:hypothetical protein OF83DRAFT_1171889 [Amylostereum chailletii]|nr:hypothetical protein OF83DRAFT_1171889 [Amylostereum chailletii]